MYLNRHAENRPKTCTMSPLVDRTLDAICIPLVSINQLNKISIDCRKELTIFE